MFKTSLFCVVLFCVLCVAVAFTSNAFGQGFPYAAPKAPEFDSQGEAVHKDAQPKSIVSHPPISPRGPTRSAPHPFAAINSGGVPAAPKAPVVAPRKPKTTTTVQRQKPRLRRAPVRRASAPRGPAYNNTVPRRKSVIATPVSTMPIPAPGQAPMGQQKFIRDCSHYVQLIAHAPNETVMRQKAKEFLTCLLQTGWSMERARKHVIATIESTYAVMRQ